MRVAMMQPTFLPWLGYFELFLEADTFVFLDDFQFVHRSFDQRNRLFVSKDKVDWITVPVDKKSGFRKPYTEVPIVETMPWRRKLWRQIEINYSKCPFFSSISSVIQPLLLKSFKCLAEQNINLILAICELLEIKCDVVYSSHLSACGKRSIRIKNLLEEVGARIYLSARGSFEYMLEDGVFPLDDISVLFQDAALKPYLQVGSTEGFVPYLSVLDALFNVGAENTRALIAGTTKHWWTWEEMLQNRE